MIVDSSRAFEKSAGVGEISLQNIWQARVLTGDGQFVRANASDLDAAAKRALEGAGWNVDPENMPQELKSTWTQVEFGNFAAAAIGLKRYRRSNKAEVKDAVATLQGYVQNAMNEQIELAQTTEAGGDSWGAYKLLAEVQTRFKGYDVPADVNPDAARLKKIPEVANELAAKLKLDQAKKVGNVPSPAAQQRAFRMLKQITEDFPGTEAAGEASSFLAGQAGN